MSSIVHRAAEPTHIPPPAAGLSPAEGRSRSAADIVASHGLVAAQIVAVAFALIAAGECHAVVSQSVAEAPKLPSLLYGLVLWYWWAIAAGAIWKLVRKASERDFFSPSSLAKHASIGILVAIAHMWVLQQTVHWLILRWPEVERAGFGSLYYLTWNRFFFELLLYGSISFAIGIVHLQLLAQRDAMRTLALEKQLSLAHLRALQMQIEPHFLFNTLNAIASLVELNRQAEAVRTLGRLSSLLNRTLRGGAAEKVPLARELELVDDYLSIEELRFQGRLRVDMTIDPGALDGMIPCFLLQPLIENAVRHGVSRCEESGTIQVVAERRASRLRLSVRDSGAGAGAEPKPGHGIGLRNTRERLLHFYGKSFEFRAGALELGGFEVVVDVPYERRK
jgi:hypothetical protein